MDIIEGILSRRSIRKFFPDKISDDLIETWLKCGMQAPSAGNEQPWHFIIIKNKEILHKIPKFHNHAQMLNQAALAILICFDPALEKHDKMAIQDCAAATQNLLLAIHSQGFGAVWLGVYPREKRMLGLKSLFQIPNNIIPFSLIAIGKSAEEKETQNRFNEKRIHYDKW